MKTNTNAKKRQTNDNSGHFMTFYVVVKCNGPLKTKDLEFGTLLAIYKGTKARRPERKRAGKRNRRLA